MASRYWEQPETPALQDSTRPAPPSRGNDGPATRHDQDSSIYPLTPRKLPQPSPISHLSQTPQKLQEPHKAQNNYTHEPARNNQHAQDTHAASSSATQDALLPSSSSSETNLPGNVPFPRLDYDHNAWLDNKPVVKIDYSVENLKKSGFDNPEELRRNDFETVKDMHDFLDVAHILHNIKDTETLKADGVDTRHLPTWEIQEQAAEKRLHQKFMDEQYELANATEVDEQDDDDEDSFSGEKWTAPKMTYEEHVASTKYWNKPEYRNPTATPKAVVPKVAAPKVVAPKVAVFKVAARQATAQRVSAKRRRNAASKAKPHAKIAKTHVRFVKTAKSQDGPSRPRSVVQSKETSENSEPAQKKRTRSGRQVTPTDRYRGV